MCSDRAFDHPIMGPKFSPIPNAKKHVFPIQQQKKKSQSFPSLFHKHIYNFTE